jgi:hypothetical protein
MALSQEGRDQRPDLGSISAKESKHKLGTLINVRHGHRRIGRSCTLPNRAEQLRVHLVLCASPLTYDFATFRT